MGLRDIKSHGSYFLAGAVIATILVKLYWPNVEIKIVEATVSDTKPIVVIDNCDTAIKCAKSKIGITAEVKKDTLYGKAFDDCKEVDFTFKLKAQSTLKHIIQIGYMFQYDVGSSIDVTYLYNLDFVAIGGGGIFNKINPGIRVVAQKAFSF